MRILLITWACDREDISEPGVSHKWVSQLVEEHDVTILGVSKPDRYGCLKEQFPHNRVIEWSDMRMPRSMARFQAVAKPGYVPFYWRARRFLKALLAKEHFDVIHHLSPFTWRYPSPAAGLAVPLLRGPLAGGLLTPPELANTVKAAEPRFMSLRKTDDARKLYDPFLRASFRQTDKLLVAAPYVLDLLPPLTIPPYEVELEHGIDDPLPFTYDVARSLERDEVNLLYVGRVVRTKGTRDAVRAMAQVSASTRVKLTIIGDGDDLEACRREAAELGVTEKVDFLGWRTKPEVDAHLANADVFLFPSFREPTGGVLLEALRHSLPCITCDYGGPAHIVDDSCGIRVPPAPEADFAQDIAAAIDRLADDPGLRHQLAKGASWRAENEFDWKSKRRRIGAIYSDLVRARLAEHKHSA